MTEPNLSCIISEGVLRAGFCAAFLVLIGMEVAVTLYEACFNIIEDVRRMQMAPPNDALLSVNLSLKYCSTSITPFSVSGIAPPLYPVLLINCVTDFVLNVTIVDAM